MIRKFFTTALLGTALMTVAVGGALAQDNVVWWDFLGGGDGVRMKKLIEDFNTEHKGKIEIQATHPRLGNAVLHQGADLGRRRRRSRHHDLSRLAHSAGGRARAR